VSDGLAIALPAELVEAIAERVAAMLEERAPADDGWLGVQAAAEYLDCKPQRIYDLKSSGRLPSGQDGTRPVFHRAVLDAYVLGGRDAARAVAAELPAPAGGCMANGRAR
jgi:helix-turn-helix protein